MDGWERKRGKLAEFNRLLRGATDTSFVVQHGDTSILPSVRYVITLDSDTQLPMEAGAAAGRHAVASAEPAALRRRACSASPKATACCSRASASASSAPTGRRSRRCSRGTSASIPYTTAVSDVYQDLFHEGSYVGKGIYDVDAFEAALAGRVPENTLLSHDLFEGFYARAGLVHRHRPGRRLSRALPRLLPRASTAGCAATGRSRAGCGARCRTPRGRTVAEYAAGDLALEDPRQPAAQPAPAGAACCCSSPGWTVLPGSPALWTTLVAARARVPRLHPGRRARSAAASRGVPLREHLRAERDTIVTSLRQAFFSTVFLAHQSVVMLDAIGRTLVRLLVTRRRLLEWVTADRAENGHADVWSVVRRMWPAPAVALGDRGAGRARRARAAAARAPDPRPLVASRRRSSTSPGGRWRIATSPLEPNASGRSFREVARRTWRFFEELVGPADHWLIPDNYQEDRAATSSRTGPRRPTSACSCSSTLAAHDFGYLSFAGVLDRLEPTFATLLRMPRYRGHFYNWYDTQTLAPLAPAYISTVDSGNLAGYLLTLRSGLASLAESRAAHRRQRARRARRCDRPLRGGGRRRSSSGAPTSGV